MEFRIGLEEVVFIDNNLNVGIGTVTPSEKLELNGNLKFKGTNRDIFFDKELNIGSYDSYSSIVKIAPLTTTSGKSTLLFSGNSTSLFGMGLEYDPTLSTLSFNRKTQNSWTPAFSIYQSNGYLSPIKIGTDNRLNIKIGGDQYGELDVRNSTNYQTLIINGERNGALSGSELIMRSGIGMDKIMLYATNGISNESRIEVDEIMFDDKIFINSGEGSDNYGEIRLTNSNQNKTVQINSQDPNSGGLGTVIIYDEGVQKIELNHFGIKTANRFVLKNRESSMDQGVFELYNQNAVRTIKIDGQHLTNDHSTIELFAGGSGAANYSKVYITANYANTGDSRIITDELEIKGGSDFAENFDIIETKTEAVPGMIVSIDPNSTGKLKITTESYDKKVAGIISGANGVETGLFMGQEGSIADGDYPVALTGRVYVLANDQGGAIKPGDFLTSSSQAGIAMKAKDLQSAQGAIIGKAMTEISENGFVLVLVNLQ